MKDLPFRGNYWVERTQTRKHVLSVPLAPAVVFSRTQKYKIVCGLPSISPAKAFVVTPGWPGARIAYTGNTLACIEPGRGSASIPKPIRRMSRIILPVRAWRRRWNAPEGGRLLADAVDAIATGTASMVCTGRHQPLGSCHAVGVQQRNSLAPDLAFIQSTHNTIGAQIGLMPVQ